jgi:hypothetical protein
MINNKSTTPPKAQLAFRIGVTGHRTNRLAQADQAPISARTREVVEHIRDSVLAVLDENDVRSTYIPDEPLLRVISPLAEGSDRLVAHVALDLGFDLQCLLPFQRDDYEKDFASAASQAEYRDLLNQASAVFELDGSRETPQRETAAYQAVGRMVLKHCDVLIAIWDGQSPEGRGGTGQIVEEALRLQIPTVWIKSQAPYETCYLQLDDYGNRQELPLDKLATRLRTILFPPEPTENDLCRTYFAEKRRCWTLLGIFYPLFVKLMTQGKLGKPAICLADIEQSTRQEWEAGWQAAPTFPREIAQQIGERFIPPYGWADKLAVYYANLYRSDFVVSYLLSGLAVLLAISGFVGAELITILLILVNIGVGSYRRWHARWIDYRLLAEQIRQMHFLAPLGRTTPAFHPPAYHSYDDPEHSWINWYFRAVIRTAGLPNARLDTAYLAAYQALLRHEINGQVNYHGHNAERSHLLLDRLHVTAYVFFILTLPVCFAHLVYDGAYSHWLTLFAVIFPAFGAAIAGILGQGEYERITKRSKAMQDQLQEMVDKLDEAPRLSSESLGEIAEEAAEIMTSEVLDWRVVFRARPLVLPA